VHLVHVPDHHRGRFIICQIVDKKSHVARISFNTQLHIHEVMLAGMGEVEDLIKLSPVVGHISS